MRTDQGAEVGFITGKVMRNMRHKYVFRAGGVPVLLWGEPPSSYIEDLLARVQNIASLTKERLLADFPRSDLRSALAMFDRRTIVRGMVLSLWRECEVHYSMVSDMWRHC